MGVVKRRVTKPADKRAPAVILEPGWVIEVDGERLTVASKTRVGDGAYTIETDGGTFTWSAAEKISVVSTKISTK